MRQRRMRAIALLPWTSDDAQGDVQRNVSLGQRTSELLYAVRAMIVQDRVDGNGCEAIDSCFHFCPK
jgi:hypothetical protein